MTLGEMNRWLAEYAREYTAAGISPEQAVALCRWKLSDKVDTQSGSEWMRLTGEWVEFVVVKRTS